MMPDRSRASMLTRPPVPTQHELSIIIENSQIKEARAWIYAARRIGPMIQEAARQQLEAIRAAGEAYRRLRDAGALKVRWGLR